MRQVNYRARRLVFNVGINGEQAVTDMRQLSGGERSMATICFLMALGEPAAGLGQGCGLVRWEWQLSLRLTAG